MPITTVSRCGLVARNPLVQAVHVALLLGTSSGHAATFTVTNENDAGAGSLRQAIIDANAAAGADNIVFDASVNTIVLTSGQLNVTDELTITGSASGGITIDGDAASRVLAVTNNTSPLTLGNVTVTNGATILNGTNPSTCLDTEGNGGGICTLSTLTLTSSTVSGNNTTGYFARGGGIFAQNNSSVTLTNSTVSGNSTTGLDGFGGGIYAATDSPVTLTNSTVIGNSTTGYAADGGGVLTIDNSPLTLTNSTVSGNSTSGPYAYGGGIYVSDNSSATITSSTISDNATTGSSAYGGAMFAGSSVTLTNSTVSGNSTSVLGAITTAGGSSLLTLESSILAGNTDGDEGNFFGLGGTSLLTAGDSLFGDDMAEIVTDNGNNVLSDAPGLAALADNGCAITAGAPDAAACVQTQALQPGSPALDAGNDNGQSFDQRGNGFPRVVGPQADIGAFEYSATTSASVSASEPIPIMGPWGLLGILSGLLALVGLRRPRR